MKLYLVHCGYYDPDVCDGQFEFHVNFFLAAEDVAQAKARAKALPDFARKRMHIDGLQEIRAVDGHWVDLRPGVGLKDGAIVHNVPYRQLAEKVM